MKVVSYVFRLQVGMYLGSEHGGLHCQPTFRTTDFRNCFLDHRWGRTLAMNKALCSKIGSGAFPSPKDVVEAGLIRLQTECGLGYRAKSLLQLGQQVCLQCCTVCKF